MAVGNIVVNFTSNYNGCHRVCYRQGGTGAYTCTSCAPCTVNCLGNGSPCSTTIPIIVDNTSCDPIDFDGYVQACCEDITSMVGRIPFSTVFNPTASCTAYEVICTTGEITDISLVGPNFGGMGYTPFGSPVVYANAVACGTATVDGAGVITGFNITVPGSYASVPTITIDLPPFYPNIEANAVAIVRCPDISDLGTDCSGQPDPQVPINPGLLLGQQFNNCYNIVANPLPVLPAGYDLNQGECCTDCISISIVNGAGGGSPQTVEYRYTTCDPKTVVTGVLTAGQTIPTVCVINGSWLLIESDPANPVGGVTIGAPC